MKVSSATALTAFPSSVKGLNFHFFIASTHGLVSTGFPLRIRTFSGTPSSRDDYLNLYFSCDLQLPGDRGVFRLNLGDCGAQSFARDSFFGAFCAKEHHTIKIEKTVRFLSGFMMDISAPTVNPLGLRKF